MRLFTKLKSIKAGPPINGLILLAVCLLVPAGSYCGTFAARISPPNFEFRAKPGDVVRDVIMIENADKATAVYQIRTADWDMADSGGVNIYPASQPLIPGSCRPWTRIERRTLKLLPNRRKNFRFEVHVPADAESRECRFAIVISPAPDTVDAMDMGNLKIPVVGAIAVIVYVTVGDAKADLAFKGFEFDTDSGKNQAIIKLYNHGNAHARPFGNVRVTDAAGRKAELVVSPFPILPGQTRDILLTFNHEFSDITDVGKLEAPLKLKGLIEWDSGSYKLDSIHENDP